MARKETVYYMLICSQATTYIFQHIYHPFFFGGCTPIAHLYGVGIVLIYGASPYYADY